MTTAAAVLRTASLLVCCAAVVLWVRGKLVCDAVLWESGPRDGSGELRGGRIICSNGSVFVGVGRGTQYLGITPRTSQTDRVWIIGRDRIDHLVFPSTRGSDWSMTGMGFQIYRGRGATSRETHVTVPLWSVALATGIGPAAWLIRWRKRCRRLCVAQGLCLRCGYDLRASPERCPECGTAVTAQIVPVTG